jgi:hypothetical protein
MRSEELVRVKSVVKLPAGRDTVVLGTVHVSTIEEIWNILALYVSLNMDFVSYLLHKIRAKQRCNAPVLPFHVQVLMLVIGNQRTGTVQV